MERFVFHVRGQPVRTVCSSLVCVCVYENLINLLDAAPEIHTQRPITRRRAARKYEEYSHADVSGRFDGILWIYCHHKSIECGNWSIRSSFHQRFTQSNRRMDGFIMPCTIDQRMNRVPLSLLRAEWTEYNFHHVEIGWKHEIAMPIPKRSTADIIKSRMCD